MLKDLQTFTVPDDFVGSRLKKLCFEVIRSWQAVALALENNTLTIKESNENIVKLFSYQLAAYVYNCEVTVEDVTEFLSIYMEQFFELLIQDNSDKYIANRVLEVYQDLEGGNEKKYLRMLEDIEEYREDCKKVKNVVNIQSSESGSESGSEEEEAAQQPRQSQANNPIEEEEDDVDEDGFQTVQPKRRFKKN